MSHKQGVIGQAAKSCDLVNFLGFEVSRFFVTKMKPVCRTSTTQAQPCALVYDRRLLICKLIVKKLQRRKICSRIKYDGDKSCGDKCRTISL